jgi:pyruvate/2-oxoglutarate/acetoin dehydrogenase E1 component
MRPEETNRQLKYSEALREAADLALERDPRVYLLGLGVPDPIGVFGTTRGLQEKYGKKRVFDMPVAENAMTGVALGSALVGMRPVMTHMRLEFAMTAIDQMCNQAAKWHYMFGSQSSVPLTIRMIVGRGWGQGPQHSQSLHAWFAHIPGLKVVAPSTPYDAKDCCLRASRITARQYSSSIDGFTTFTGRYRKVIIQYR